VDTVDMSIYGLQQLLNEIKTKKTLAIFPKVFSNIAHAFLSFGERERIKKFVWRIFDYYINEKKQQTVSSWPTIQFIMLKRLSSNANA